jgi:hypothetical protein
MREVPGPTVGDFLAQLEAVPWFSNLGRPTPPDAGVERISAWDAWPGPEEPAIGELSFRHQELYDRITAEAGAERAGLTELWEAIHAAVFRRATSRVPHGATQDAWHGPTAAVWQAAWTAGLVGLCLRTGRPVPPELQEEWSWYARGHWPSGYRSLGPDGRPGPLLVY